jgi:uncharacterized membrane protein YjjP (DUF1212 family)
LAVFTGWLMRAVVLGAIHPVDVLYLGTSVVLTEGALFVTGLTRNGPSVRTGMHWLQLVGGLAVPHGLQTLLSLAISSVLYRLFYADAYVAALVVGPGFLYAALGCGLALPVVRSIERSR